MHPDKQDQIRDPQSQPKEPFSRDLKCRTPPRIESPATVKRACCMIFIYLAPWLTHGFVWKYGTPWNPLKGISSQFDEWSMESVWKWVLPCIALQSGSETRKISWSRSSSLHFSWLCPYALLWDANIAAVGVLDQALKLFTSGAYGLPSPPTAPRITQKRHAQLQKKLRFGMAMDGS